MDNLFEIRFSFEQKVKDAVIYKFSNKQGGDFNVFSYHWQCFVWAAVVGFIHDERRPLQSPIADKPFSLNTIINADAKKCAQALVCMCIAKAGTIDIMKDPQAAITLINEYANGGFYYIMNAMNGESISNDLEWVKQEIFSRGEDTISPQKSIAVESPISDIPETDDVAMQAAMQDMETESRQKTSQSPKERSRWTTSQVGELKLYLRQGMDAGMLAAFFHKSVEDVEAKIKELNL